MNETSKVITANTSLLLKIVKLIKENVALINANVTMTEMNSKSIIALTKRIKELEKNK